MAFEYGGDLWVVSRSGGTARRLTSTPSVEADPHFSPDGSLIAFSATVAGNTDVYVVPTAGGAPKRLTYHPGIDVVRGWTPDGRRVIFASDRDVAPHPYFRLWTVGLDGSMPEPLPLPRAYTGAFSPDGQRLAYEEISVAMFPAWAQNQSSQWRHYRGGRTHPIRIMSMGQYVVEQLPWNNSNDTDPMWVGNTIYFLSDRNHTVNLFAYNLDTKALTQLTRHDDFDIKSASATGDAIVYEQAGYIHLLDTRTGQSEQLNIEVTGDFPWARPQFKKVAGMIRSAALSPTGVRAVFEARGDIFTVPAEKGDYRNLTQSSGAHDCSPAWSPDGSQLAWFSDGSGEYQLLIGDSLGATKPRAVALPSAAFFSGLSWSPDGKHLLFQDNHLNFWMLDAASGQTMRIDIDAYADPLHEPDAVWSPDSQWLAYSKVLDNHMRAIFLYSLVAGKAMQLTDGMSDAISPAFDAGGKYLYFLASTDFGPRTGWLEMSSLDRPVRRAIYITVLGASEPSPLLPETGDEPHAPPREESPDASEPRTKHDKASASVTLRIDLPGIRQRILALNIPAGDYGNLTSGASGTIFYTESVPSPGGTPASLRLQRYQLRERTAAPFLEGIRSYTLSADKKKLLYQAAGGNRWGIVSTERPAKVGDGPINVAQLEMLVDPRAEWAQIFRETWRIQREFFYDPKMHG
ncbi:MAG: PD40 domain-containing protein, partial [Alphaproteobacteria bacterium]|nr:PD40 domain-containing protein [Alphaproteobacteria bacterium]